MCRRPAAWRWSSYAATAGYHASPSFLHVESVLAQFSDDVERALARYRDFVADGVGQTLWENLQGRAYLGSEPFAERYSKRVGRTPEIPRIERQPVRPLLDELVTHAQDLEAIANAYRVHGYRLGEIARRLGVSYSTGSGRLREAERTAEANECKT